MNPYRRWKFTVLLAAMLALLAVRLATAGAPESQVVRELCAGFFLIAAILTVGGTRRFRAAALLLGIPAIVGTCGVRAFPPGAAHAALLAGRLFSVAFLAFIVIVILQTLLTERAVTWDSLIGTFCGYLLIGLIWTESFIVLEMVSPDALHIAADPANIPVGQDERWRLIQYFSFATLTTLGYGDVVPVSAAARVLACMEAICGQFYLAVLVAGLVGVHMSKSSPE